VTATNMTIQDNVSYIQDSKIKD